MTPEADDPRQETTTMAARVETEWANGNLSDDVRDRILGDDR